MIFRRKRKDPDYAFEKVTEEEIAFRKRSNKQTLLVIAVTVIILGFAVVVLVVDTTKSSYETQNPVGDLVITLPENKTEYEIYHGQEFAFDIAAYYKVGEKITYYGISDHDRCQIGMFFSDNRLCERIAYDTVVLTENAKVGTEFTVTLKYNNQLSLVEFTVVEAPAKNQETNQAK